MIPILFDKTATSFTSNGLGRLAGCIRCIVTEVRNGIYECEFDYPVTGSYFNEIQIGRIIACTHDEQGDVQPFDIYAKSEPINGVVTFNAHHISYRLNEIPVKPFTAGSCAEALSKIDSQSVVTNPFTFWTDKSVTASYISEMPRSAKAMLGGEQNSILDVFGTGEYEYDKFSVNLYLHRGQDTNVSIRYGKNLIDMTNQYDAGDTYTAVVPFWLGDETVDGETVTTLVTLPEWILSSGQSVPSGREVIVPMDLSSEFSEKPSVSDLRTKAQSRLSSSDAWLPNQTVTINFVQLWQTEEYKDFAPLQRLRLCDTCGVFVPMYGMSLRAKVIKVVYNVLLDRYDEMELGDKPTTYTAVLEKIYDSKVAGVQQGFQAIKVDIQTVEQNAAADATQKANAAEQNAKGYTDGQIASAKSTIETEYEQAIEDATELIRGGTGGYIVTTVNANGQPIELLITDNIDINQAVNVWRWNLGGLAHSHSGYNGPFNDVAITQDGKINATMIVTGILNADLIQAGTLSADRLLGETLKIGGQNDSNGIIEIYNSNTVPEVAAKIDAKSFSSYNRSKVNGGYRGTVISAGRLEFYNDANAPFAQTDLVGSVDGAGTSQDRYLTLQAKGRLYLHSTTPSGVIHSYIHLYPETQTTSISGDTYDYDIALSGETLCKGDVVVDGNVEVLGGKLRIVKTDNYATRGLYCYETPTPLFGDIGEAVLDEEGICYVDLDDIFTETIADKVEYQVFLQKEGEGDCWIAGKDPRYFVIKGTPGLRVAWELKAKQRNYETNRLELSNNGLEQYSKLKDDKQDLFDAYITEQEELLYG